MEQNTSRLPLIDAHVHFWGRDDLQSAGAALLAFMSEVGADRLNVVCTLDPYGGNSNPAGIYLKASAPSRVYLFGGLEHHSSMGQPPEVASANLGAQVDRLHAMGCDGLKMIEGKPTDYKLLPIPFDGPAYADLFARLEELAFPLLMHLNDPETFWDRRQAPAWALERNWFYGDGTFPTKEALYQQLEHVLERHPKLTVIFAHFYFLSADLPRAARLLDRYPNVHLDVTPGSEMYLNFALDPEATRALFMRYQDRIIFGTDSSDGALRSDDERARTRGKFRLMKRFLETDEAFDGQEELQRAGRVQGIALPPEVLRKIYATNFERLTGRSPAPLSRELAAAECARLAYIFDRGIVLSEGFARMRPRPATNLARQVEEWLQPATERQSEQPA